ncbi:MAG: hypothetical protein AAF840_15635, partial [Bacteroidota bacterium]
MKFSLPNKSLATLLLGLTVYAFSNWYWGFNGLYGQDAHEYLRYSRALQEFLLEGVPPGDFFWPLLYPLLGAVGGCLLGDALIPLQLVSLFAFVGTGSFLVRWLKAEYLSKETAVTILVVATFCLTPFVLRASLLIMSDALAMFAVVGCYFAYAKYVHLGGKRWLILAALLAGCALMTRYVSFLLLLGPALHLLVVVYKRRDWPTLFAAFAVLLLPCLPHFFLRGDELFGFLNHNYLGQWSVLHWWQRVFIRQDGQQTFLLPNIIYAFSNLFHPGYGWWMIVVVLFLKRRDLQAGIRPVLLASLLIYSGYIAGIATQNLRFLLLTFPLWFYLLFPTILRAWQWSEKYLHQWHYGLLIPLLVIQL